ncbi:MAG: mucoidy inhibitor MuiA family protein, partial [Flavobacteriales bacterium]|nr:mucoidy inhibitor MuiA family protein [Flavobacteriales bacterium]
SSKLETSSIQVQTGDQVQLLSVSSASNFEDSKPETKRIKRLRDSITLLSDNMRNYSDEINAYDSEKQMLLRNQSIAGNQNGVSISELKLASDFFRSRILDINKRITIRNSKRSKLEAIKLRKSQQLNELTGHFSSTLTTKEISILLKAKSSTSTTITLKYLISSAGWAPNYDLRAEDISKPIHMIYRAKVFNNSNIAWKNVKLKLSTADPRQSANKPTLTKWVISRYSGNSYGGFGSIQNKVSERSKSEEKKTITKDGVQYEEIELPELVSEFIIKERYDIPSDAKPYIVDVTEYDLPATFKHFAIPKIEQAAFLLARITGWEDLNLVEGPANIYYGGAYIGRSYIKTSGTNDTLDLSLGRDSKVVVTRKKKKDYTKSQLIGSSKKDILWFDITVKNNRKAPINIELLDQIPISGDNSISITALEISKAIHDETSGQLTWNYTIEPSAVKTHELKFMIKYPKSMRVSTRRHYSRIKASF